MTSFFDKNIGAISGRVQALNHLCNEIEPTLDLSKPDYENVELIRAEAHRKGLKLPPRRAFKILCRIKQKQAGWKIAE